MQSNKQAGFTLIELLVSMVVLGVTLAITTTFILGVREKAILQRDSDQIVQLLEFARRQSIAAYNGQQYSLVFQPDSVITVEPGTTKRTISSRLEVETVPDTNTITFNKLTGTLSRTQEINLKLSGLKTTITIDKGGLISQDNIERQ